MKNLYFLLFFFTNFVFAQFSEIKFDTHLIYKGNVSVDHFYINNLDNSIFYYTENKDYDRAYNLVFIHKNKLYNSRGALYLQKYFDADFNDPIDHAMTTGGKKFIKGGDDWSYKDYTNMRMIHTEVEDLGQVRLFFMNNNDNTDYSLIANHFLKVQYWPEITNYNEVVGKGWVLVTGYYVEGDTEISFTTDLFSVSKEDFTIKYSEINLEKIGDSDGETELILPEYCTLLPDYKGVDNLTQEKLDGLIWATCRFYDFFGRYNADDNLKFFDESATDILDYNIREKNLNSKQIAKFREAAKVLRKQIEVR